MQPIDLAEAVRRACLEAALQAYEDAGVRGLCAEGRWDLAVDAVRNLELASCLGGEGVPGTLGTRPAP